MKNGVAILDKARLSGKLTMISGPFLSLVPGKLKLEGGWGMIDVLGVFLGRNSDRRLVFRADIGSVVREY